MRARPALLAALAVVTSALVPSAASAASGTTSQNGRVTVSDGVELAVTVTGQAPLAPRPVLVEFSPYGRGSGTLDPGPAYNQLLVQLRGTGDSHGRFDALGPRTQADVAEVLGWACHQPWSDGRLAINGFSASAITIYNALHLKLPCVTAAVLKSGTFELYRDLLSPGGINNLVPGIGVMGLIGAPALAQGPDRDPATAPDVLAGLLGAGLGDLLHPTLDAWWRERGFRGDANHLPILMVDGFFDVESRGAFQAYQELRGDGAHLLVAGAHDGAPAGTDGGTGEMRAWLDHYVRGVDNGVQRHPRVQLLLADGDREDWNAGHVVAYAGPDWPIPGTRWTTFALAAQRSGTAGSLNDGSLVPATGARVAPVDQTYPALPAQPLAADPANAAILGAGGLNALTTALPVLSDLTLAEPLALTYTTSPFPQDLLAAGPATLELRLASTAPQTNLWAVLADVWPDGTAHPLTAGRLSSDYPAIDRGRSLVRDGVIVQPYNRFDAKAPAAPGQARTYEVELWPVGNRFRAGHRLRLAVLGASAASVPGLPALNTVRVGGAGGSVLRFPVLPAAAASVAPASLPALRLSVTPRRVRPGTRRLVRVRVRSTRAACVRRAIVRVAGRRVVTDARGRARLRITVRRPGRRVVRVTHAGCRPARAVVLVTRAR